ncbi:hypothetical protein PA598K_06875 [Paenibacillus sp. 598K]|nr:hypothetical protein PA598K_06875 [Paenibacillus sp. 598K]
MKIPVNSTVIRCFEVDQDALHIKVNFTSGNIKTFDAGINIIEAFLLAEDKEEFYTNHLKPLA